MQRTITIEAANEINAVLRSANRTQMQLFVDHNGILFVFDVCFVSVCQRR